MTKSSTRSRALARRVRAHQHCCFANCQRAVARLPELAGATYVEGIAVRPEYRLLFEHAWIELDGVILDPTLPDHRLAYFGGIRADGPDGLTAAKRGRNIRRRWWDPLFYQFGSAATATSGS